MKYCLVCDLFRMEDGSCKNCEAKAAAANQTHYAKLAIDYDTEGPFRSPMFMPRWASRITLRITGVRVERVQAISFSDCIAEGCDTNYKERVDCCQGEPDCTGNHFGEKWQFQRRWQQINGKRAPWESNPWVWVVEFEKLEAKP